MSLSATVAMEGVSGHSLCRLRVESRGGRSDNESSPGESTWDGGQRVAGSPSRGVTWVRLLLPNYLFPISTAPNRANVAGRVQWRSWCHIINNWLVINTSGRFNSTGLRHFRIISLQKLFRNTDQI